MDYELKLPEFGIEYCDYCKNEPCVIAIKDGTEKGLCHEHYNQFKKEYGENANSKKIDDYFDKIKKQRERQTKQPLKWGGFVGEEIDN